MTEHDAAGGAEAHEEKGFVGPYALYALVVAAVALLAFNQYTLLSVQEGIATGDALLQSEPSSASDKPITLTGDPVQDAINALIPTGTPPYGEEMGVTYDDPVGSLRVLATWDRGIPTSDLTPEERQRYISIGTRISCEFCCGAPSVIDKNARDLCGCSHAAAFRGLSKWLIRNRGSEYTDEEILWELTKWKSLFYPKSMITKYVAAQQAGLDITPDVLNDRYLLQKIKTGDTSAIGRLPEMVGGC